MPNIEHFTDLNSREPFAEAVWTHQYSANRDDAGVDFGIGRHEDHRIRTKCRLRVSSIPLTKSGQRFMNFDVGGFPWRPCRPERPLVNGALGKGRHERPDGGVAS